MLTAVRAIGSDAVSFRKDIAPVLQAKCIACHGPEKQKGGFRLDSFEWLQKSGDSGDAPVIAGDAGASLMIKLVSAADEDDRMPQKDDPLPPEFIDILKNWINAGANFDGTNPKQSLADLVPPKAHPAPPDSYPHPIPVLSLAWLDDSRLAIGGYHEVIVREVESGKLLQRLTNLPERVHALLPVNERHQLLYAGGNPGRVGEMGIIDLDEGAADHLPKVLARSTDTFLAVALSPDGTRVAVGGADKIIRIIDLEAKKELRQLTQHADWVMGLAFNHDGSRLASASRDGTARIFDPATGDMICAFREHDGTVFDVTFVGDGSQAVSAGRDGHVRFWKTDNGEQTKDMGDMDAEVFKLAAAGNSLLCALGDGSIRELSMTDRKAAKRWHSDDSTGTLAIAWSNDGHGFAGGRGSGSIELWKIEDDKPGRSFSPWP